MRALRWTRIAVTTLVATTTIAACWTVEVDRSAEENQETTGWQDRGRDPGRHTVDRRRDPITGETSWDYVLKYHDVILTPDGTSLLVQVPIPGPNAGWDAPGMVLTLQTLSLDATTVVFDDLINIRRINFAPDGSAAYVLGEDGRRVTRIDLQSFATTHLATFDEAFSALDVSPDGRFIIGSNIVTHDLLEWLNLNGSCSPNATISMCAIGLWDTTDLKARQIDFTERLRDLDFAPDGSILLTSSTWDAAGEPVASVAFVDGSSGAVTTTVSFPNCADELKLQPGGELALLAPIRCLDNNGDSSDPISVINLKTREFVTNLPGFGPVEISEDGSRAVGFTRKDDMQNVWGYDQAEEVGLIVVALPSLKWDVIEYGHDEPSYLLTGLSGRWIYAHHKTVVCDDQPAGGQNCSTDTSPLYRFDADSGSRIAVSGTDARLDRFVRSGDTLYLLTDHALTALSVGAAEATKQPLPHSPELINVTPDGQTLVFGEDDEPRFYTAPVGDAATQEQFVVTAETSPPLGGR